MSLIGKKFGKLTVQRVACRPLKKDPNSRYVCKCECGKPTTVYSKDLTSGKTKSCGCSRIKDVTGQKFDMLTAIKRMQRKDKSGNVTWKCKCECGNTKIQSLRTLVRADRHHSCGNCKIPKRRSKCLDIPIGTKINYLTVLGKAVEKGCYTTYNCKCVCGRTTQITAVGLLYHDRKSCGCFYQNLTDLTGMRFNMLTAVERIHLNTQTGYPWKWLCDCGGTVVEESAKVIRGFRKNCGCTRKKDIIGEKFGNWEVIALPKGITGKYQNYKLMCRCKCGREQLVQRANLRTGASGGCTVCAAKDRWVTRIKKMDELQKMEELQKNENKNFNYL